MQTQTSSYSDILKKRVKFRSAQELLRRNPYISEALHSRMSTSSMDNTLISASSTISSVDTYFTVNDDLVILPQEIILYILEFNYIKENYIVSFCGKYYFELIHLYILDRVKRFDLREQNYQGKALEALLSRGNLLESIFLTKNFSAQTSIHVTDRLLIGLNKLNAVELRYLHVKACDFISEIGFRAIGDACTNLLVLNLSYMRNLSSNALQYILKSNQNLRCLYLERSMYAGVDSTLHVLSIHCPLLKTLSVCYCSKITDVGITYLAAGCKYLRDLNLGHCSDISSFALKGLITNCRLIKVLSLEWCLNVDDSVVYALANNSSHLEALGIEHCSLVSDNSVACLVETISNLTFLSADSCSNIGMVTSTKLSECLKGIRDLYLNNCRKIDDKAVEVIVSKCDMLVNVGIEECSITDAAVIYLADHCKQITTLGLNGNRGITDGSIVHLVKNIPAIERIYLSNTSVSNASLFAIADYCQQLSSLSVVDCKVNYLGLLRLGRQECKCCSTLRDLHISSSMQYARNFYGEHFHAFTKRLAIEHPEAIKININPNDENQPSNVMLVRTDEPNSGPILDPQSLIFSHGLPKVGTRYCIVYLR